MFCNQYKCSYLFRKRISREHADDKETTKQNQREMEMKRTEQNNNKTKRKTFGKRQSDSFTE